MNGAIMKSKYIIVFLLGLFVFFSCKQEDIHLENTPPVRLIKNKILVILGEDYYMRPGILNYLEKNYNLYDENSTVKLFTYESMLNSSGSLILRSIAEAIEHSDCDIIIALGVPEGSARYFTQVKNTHPEKIFISILPMEDTLPLEACCDIVLDFKLPDTLLNEEEIFSVTDENVELLLISSIFAAEDMLTNTNKLSISIYEEFNRAFFAAYSVLFSHAPVVHNFRLSPYLDPETSIPSRTYFIVNEIDTNDDK